MLFKSTNEIQKIKYEPTFIASFADWMATHGFGKSKNTANRNAIMKQIMYRENHWMFECILATRTSTPSQEYSVTEMLYLKKIIHAFPKL